MKLKELYEFIRVRLNDKFNLLINENDDLIHLKISNKNFKAYFLIKNTDDMLLLKERAEAQILKHLNGAIYK